MKKFLLISLSMLLGVTIAHSQSGTWTGELNIQGNRLPLVFHFDVDNPCLDSPAQRVKAIPMQVTKGNDGDIAVSISLVNATFHGKLAGNEIIGIFSQNGLDFPLTLSPGAQKPKRPQTPVASASYSEEEVVFANGDATLSGTLTLPDGYSRNTPVLIMITGSGLQNRDEEIFDHKPFAVIADALARKGIATLRYDDRGFGKSTGNAVNCTTEDLMYDALAGMDLLRRRFDRVGVLGHSEGGTIALMLAAEDKADFVVSLAGMVVSGKETLLQQNRLALTEAGIPETTVDEYCELLTLLFDNDKNFENRLGSSTLPPTLRQNLKGVATQIRSPYMRYFLSLDIRERLGSVKCPVLALNGTKDTQVFYVDNLASLRNGLPKNESNKIIAAEGLNHLFQHCTNGSVLEYATIEETISPEILDIIIQWITTL